MRSSNAVKPVFLLISGLILGSGCASSRFQTIDAYVRQQDWQKATTALEMAIEANPTDGEAHLQLAEVYAESGMISQMSASLLQAQSVSANLQDRAEFIRKTYWAINFKRGNYSFDDRLYREAAFYFGRAVQIDSSNIYSMRQYAAALFKAGHYRQAEEVYRHILDGRPDDLSSKNNLAEILFIRKRYAQCIELCDLILADSEPDTQTLKRRAYAYDALGEFENAEKDYLLAAALQPSAQLLTDLGLLYFKRGAYREAIARFTEALALSDAQAQLYSHLGEANWQIHDYVEMARWYQKIVQFYPDNLSGWKNLAVAYEILGKKDLLAEARHYIHRISSTN